MLMSGIQSIILISKQQEYASSDLASDQIPNMHLAGHMDMYGIGWE